MLYKRCKFHRNLRTFLYGVTEIPWIHPNEIFYEIFEYLNTGSTYKAFSNLNSRFENLLNCSILPLKITLESDSELSLEHYCRHVIIPNRDRIISISILDETLSGLRVIKAFNVERVIRKKFSDGAFGIVIE